VFHSSFVENRVLSSLNPDGISLYGRVVPVAPYSQVCNSLNNGTDVK
jgi:hypothetical protein